MNDAQAPRLWARLTWQAADPAAIAADLARRLGIESAPHGWQAEAHAVPLGNATLEVVPWRRESPSDDPRRAAGWCSRACPAASRSRAPPERRRMLLAGVGWATVELDRAEAELAEWLAGDAPDPAADALEPVLGARCASAAADGLPGAELVLLEPTTEGRLAASLARDGEGPCALYAAAGRAAWTRGWRRRAPAG